MRYHSYYMVFLGTYKGKRISVISTGIGSDNIDIVLNELDALTNIDFTTRTIKEKLNSFIDYWGYNNEATYKVSSEIKLLRRTDQKVKLILEERNIFFRQQCEQIIQILNDGGSLKSNFTYREASDILCNLLSEDTWAYFNEMIQF